MGRRWRICAACLAIGAAAAGCGDEDLYKGPRRAPLDAQSGGSTVPFSEYAVYGPEGKPYVPPRTSLGADVVPGDESGPDYIQKADIYWRLNWVKVTLETGIVPSNLRDVLERVELQAAPTRPDDRKTLIGDIVATLKEGLAAEEMDARFRQRGIDPSSVPWGTGRLSVEQRLRQRTRDLSRSSRRSTDISREVTAYEERHHASPSEVKRSAFRRASASIDRLGERLGLLGRAQGNPDGIDPTDIGDILPPVPGSEAPPGLRDIPDVP